MDTQPLSDPHRDVDPAVARRPGWTDRAARAGVLAALLMLLVQLLWRLEWASAGVQAFPEFVLAAIARLTPLSIFGFATENYGSLAKNSLFVGILLGILAVGYEAGGFAGRLSEAGRVGRGLGGRLVAGLLVAAALLLFTLVVILPIAKLGVFAIDSRLTGEILLQLGTTFALFGVAWAVLGRPAHCHSRRRDDRHGSRGFPPDGARARGLGWRHAGPAGGRRWPYLAG